MGGRSISSGICPFATWSPKVVRPSYWSLLFSGSIVNSVPCTPAKWSWLWLSRRASISLGLSTFSHLSLPTGLRTCVSPPGECGLRCALAIAKHRLFSSACFRWQINFCLFLSFIAPAAALRSFRNCV